MSLGHQIKKPGAAEKPAAAKGKAKTVERLRDEAAKVVEKPAAPAADTPAPRAGEGLVLERIGLALYGRTWRAQLADLLRVTSRTLYNWDRDGVPLSADHCRVILSEIDRREAEFTFVRGAL